MSKKITCIVAHTHISRAIAKDGHLPWGYETLTTDLKFVKSTTTETTDPKKRNAVVMGRKTWDSIPIERRPLSGRLNVILTRGIVPSLLSPDIMFRNNLIAALNELNFNDNIESIFILGGAEIYKTMFDLNLVDVVYTTIVCKEFTDCDTHFPPLPKNTFSFESTTAIFKDNEIMCKIKQFSRDPSSIKRIKLEPAAAPRHEEYQYLDLVKEILISGQVKGDRTGTGTKSLFGRTMRFSLRNNVLPLITTKRTFWRGVALELLWFISGKTDAATLREQGVNIWEGNSSREFLDSVGLSHHEVGDLGPVYGFQWRHFGAEYKTMHDDYTGQGVDQLKELIDTIKRDPNSRRLILTAWNPSSLKEMALPPCHLMSQFYVSSDGELSCQMYQRSADMGLGVPFNIASYALLTRLIAQCCDLKCGELVHVIGDAHVYLNHEDALMAQLCNTPTPFPTLNIKNIENRDIDKFTFEEFELIGYNPHQSIPMKMAI